METIRLAVRTLVEFTLHGEDILRLGGAVKDMQDGMLGHKARQSLLGDGWEAEVPLSLTVPVVGEEAELAVSGRIDALRSGEIPVIEEIKLWQSRVPPETPIPAHEAQAVCYGHMLCEERGIPQVIICVAYVDKRGHERARFEQQLTAQACRTRFEQLVENYVRRLRLIRTHRRARNATLQMLAFPYPDYRAGQREMAVQVYTAVRLGRRLFAGMPTGTGKSVAALFPALKALGEGLTGQVYYLTARTTQRQGALEALSRLRRQPLHLWQLTLDAKDRQCPEHTVCHPDYCPRAKGHFLRDSAAVEEMMAQDDWSPENIRRMADEHCLCPFEFSLALAEIADIVVCDYNYALDPVVHIRRVFDRGSNVTLLIDEAHNLLQRLRDMLGGVVDGPAIRRLRTAVGKAAGRKHFLYQAMTAVLRALDDLPVAEEAQEGRIDTLPQSLEQSAAELAQAFLDAEKEHIPWGDAGETLGETIMSLWGFVRACRREGTACAWLWHGRKTRTVTAFALDVGEYFRETTSGASGVVCFSATLEPLHEMKRLLGGEEEDACFAMPSPFPPENLLLLQADVNTRYAGREAAVEEINRAITCLVQAHPGRYIVFFPSFAFLRMAAEQLDLPFQQQRSGMSEEERKAFLAPYHTGGAPMLSLCVLGGIFAEGIDLPGDALDGVVIVGVGLPQVNLFQETLRQHYEETLQGGFLYAYQIPGMQKVAQAVGRVIRTETDCGVALLLDDRYRQSSYQRLCPPHWQMQHGVSTDKLKEFWQRTEEAT